MPDMKSTSASLYGSRPRPGGVACRPDDGALAQPAASAATNRTAEIAGRETVLIHPPGDASYAIRPQVGTPRALKREPHLDLHGPRGLIRVGHAKPGAARQRPRHD